VQTRTAPPNDAFRGARLAKGLKPVDLAAAAKCSVPTIYNLEKGTYQPSLGMARRLAAALGTTVDAIFPETGQQPGAAA
jgi:putative transcriptional regulator